MNPSSASTSARRARRLGLPALVLLVTSIGFTTTACGHTHHEPYTRAEYASYDGYYGNGFYRDVTRSFYQFRNRRAKRHYYRRLDSHGRRFFRSLEDHHRRVHRRRGTRHRWGDSRSNACRAWEARWRPDRRDRYNRRDGYDRRYDNPRNRRHSYSSVTLEYYRNRGRRNGQDFFVSLDVPLKRFYRSLDRHHERYHSRNNSSHRWNSYRSGACYDWELQWDDDRYSDNYRYDRYDDGYRYRN